MGCLLLQSLFRSSHTHLSGPGVGGGADMLQAAPRSPWSAPTLDPTGGSPPPVMSLSWSWTLNPDAPTMPPSRSECASCSPVGPLPPQRDRVLGATGSTTASGTCVHTMPVQIPGNSLESKPKPSLTRPGDQPGVLTGSQGWAGCGAARLGWSQASSSSLLGCWSHCHLEGPGVLAGWAELRWPASFVSAAVCRSGAGGIPDSGPAPRARWFCLSSALTQKRFSSRPGGLTIRLGLSHLGTWLGSVQGPGELHCGCSLGSGLSGPPSGS